MALPPIPARMRFFFSNLHITHMSPIFLVGEQQVSKGSLISRGLYSAEKRGE